MGTGRAHARIDRPAADVWAAVTDPTAISHWFPGVAEWHRAEGLTTMTAPVPARPPEPVR